jgi:NAD(P)-dependent dehydrogenase (short-subunit alcohol dehydrogenase family)
MADMSDYTGRLALVTGAGDGIGRMLATQLAQSGMRVVVQDVRRDAAEATAAAIGGDAVALVFDVSDRDAAVAAAAELKSRGDAISVLCINAGVGVGSPITTGRANVVEWAYAVNVLGVIWTAQAFRPLLANDGPRHLVVTASSAALRAPTGDFPLYAATKHATFAVAEALQSEWAADGIGTTILCPGLLNTNIWNAARARPQRFGGEREMDPAVASRWREAKSPALMWPHIRHSIERGGGYLVCATEGGETRLAFEARTRAIADGIVEI